MGYPCRNETLIAAREISMLEFISLKELEILRWLHIIAMAYWLGGEWGVFQTSYKVVNTKLAPEERMRHMDTAFRIDDLARIGIITLLPLGLHMGHIHGVQPYGGSLLVGMWGLYTIWLGITLGAFFKRGTTQGDKLLKIGDWTRYIIIPLLIISGLSSLFGYGPFEAGEGQKWFAAKVLTYGSLLIIGVILRVVMHEWQVAFKVLAEGPNQAVEQKLDKSIRLARRCAYLYWFGIALTAFFAAVKPF